MKLNLLVKKMTIELVQSNGIYFEYREKPDWNECVDERDGGEYWFDLDLLPEAYLPLHLQSYDFRGFGFDEEIDGEF